LSVSRPIELVVLNCCVTETNRHTLGVEELDQPGKIGERAGRPVDLVDDHDVDPAGSDIGDQLLQGGSLQIATGEPAIVIAGSDQCPALVSLAADEGLAGFALRRERVEHRRRRLAAEGNSIIANDVDAHRWGLLFASAQCRRWTTLTLSSRGKAALFRRILWRCSATAEHEIAQPKPRDPR
jgi:hypothetical protein